MKILYRIVQVVLTLASFNLWADSGSLNVKIRLPKTVFFQKESIPISFTVENTAQAATHLKISDYEFLNYYIEVFTPQRVSVKETDEFFSRQFNIRGRLKLSGGGNKYFRNIQLQPSQILGQQVNLLSYYDLKPGVYIVRGKFYPMTSYFNPSREIATPYVKIIIKEDPLKEKEAVAKRERLKRSLADIRTPNDSVKAFFNGKLYRRWREFFYVIDLRRMIKQFPIFYKSFKKAADQEKNQVVKDFKSFLKELNRGERLVSFDITETIIRKKHAVVKVEVAVRFRDMLIKREYKFGLLRKDHWYIYGYTVLQK